MKTKHIVIPQVVLLALTVLAGYILKGDLADGPRLAHRMLGSLAGVLCVISLVVIYSRKATKPQLVAGVLAVALSLTAGLAGKMLKSSEDYQTYFNIMRLSGVLALISSVVLLKLVIKSNATRSSGSPQA